MNCISSKTTTGTTVKRRYIPMRFTIPAQGSYVRQHIKIPYTNCKVVGLLTTTRIEQQCSDTTMNYSYYGTAPSLMKDTSFLPIAKVHSYSGPYPEDVLFGGQQKQWWYYAHPLIENTPYPTIIDNGGITEGIQLSNPPINISITPKGECTPRPYLLWSGALPEEGEIQITFGEYTGEGS